MVENPPVNYLFHGTSDTHLDSIMEHGLKSPYLTSDYEKAGYYATEVSQETGGEPIVLKVKIPNVANLKVDFNELDEPVMTSEKAVQAAYKKYIAKNPDRYDKKSQVIDVDKHAYWVSLSSTRTVWYDGIIPAENIVFDGNNYLTEAYYTTWKKIQEIGPLEFGEGYTDLDQTDPIDSFNGQQEEIVRKLAKHFKIGKTAPLGSGTNGFAYYIPNNRVLKVTKDKSEVAESHKILEKKCKHLANIYGTYALHGKYEGTYVIISELLDRSGDIEQGDDFLSNFFENSESEHYDYTFRKFNIDHLLAQYRLKKITPIQIKSYVNDLYDYYGSDTYKAQLAEWYLKGMFAIVDELKVYNIQSTDWGITNLGVKKDGALAMYDMGYGDTSVSKDVPNIHLNEKKKELEEYWSADEYPEFTDGQFNPTFKDRAYLPTMNMNTAPLAEDADMPPTIEKLQLPLEYDYMWGDFLAAQGGDIAKILPQVAQQGVQSNTRALVRQLAIDSPDVFQKFANWIYEQLHGQQ